jgi:hypothetical protein
MTSFERNAFEKYHNEYATRARDVIHHDADGNEEKEEKQEDQEFDQVDTGAEDAVYEYVDESLNRSGEQETFDEVFISDGAMNSGETVYNTDTGDEHIPSQTSNYATLEDSHLTTPQREPVKPRHLFRKRRARQGKDQLSTMPTNKRKRSMRRFIRDWLRKD